MYSAANYSTIMVEFENRNREMAVDVPASFIAQAKTPPRLDPPPLLHLGLHYIYGSDELGIKASASKCGIKASASKCRYWMRSDR